MKKNGIFFTAGWFLVVSILSNHAFSNLGGEKQYRSSNELQANAVLNLINKNNSLILRNFIQASFYDDLMDVLRTKIGIPERLLQLTYWQMTQEQMISFAAIVFAGSTLLGSARSGVTSSGSATSLFGSLENIFYIGVSFVSGMQLSAYHQEISAMRSRTHQKQIDNIHGSAREALEKSETMQPQWNKLDEEVSQVSFLLNLPPQAEVRLKSLARDEAYQKIIENPQAKFVKVRLFDLLKRNSIITQDQIKLIQLFRAAVEQQSKRTPVLSLSVKQILSAQRSLMEKIRDKISSVVSVVPEKVRSGNLLPLVSAKRLLSSQIDLTRLLLHLK